MEKLVLIIEHTDNCTYSYDSHICFNYESKQKAKDDFDSILILTQDSYNKNEKQKNLIENKITKLLQKKISTHYGDDLDSLNKEVQSLYNLKNEYLKKQNDGDFVFNNKKFNLYNFTDDNGNLVSPRILTLDEWFLSNSI